MLGLVLMEQALPKVEEITTNSTALVDNDIRCDRLYVDEVRRQDSGRYTIILRLRKLPQAKRK